MRAPFALVTEGPTDQEVIVSILSGFYKNFDIYSSILQPSRSINVEEQTPGGWTHLLAYLESQKFRDAFATNEFIIIHSDTDICDEPMFGVEKASDMAVLLPEVVKRLVLSIGQPFYNIYKNRIIFAICVDSIECWLLPLYFENMRSKRNKQTGCISTLNEVLKDHHDFYLDSKELSYYREMSKPYGKNSRLVKSGKMNQSLQSFLDMLPDVSLLPVETED